MEYNNKIIIILNNKLNTLLCSNPDVQQITLYVLKLRNLVR